MHEMALCESILATLEDEAGPRGYTRVWRVRLGVGVLSCVEPDALTFNFEVVARGTLADGAALELVSEPGEAWCSTCARTVEVRDLLDACPHCGGYPIRVTGGDGLRIKELEVE